MGCVRVLGGGLRCRDSGSRPLGAGDEGRADGKDGGAVRAELVEVRLGEIGGESCQWRELVY